MQKLLFICSRNQWRSPTAEWLFRNHTDIAARSAGTSPAARVRLTEKMLLWADTVFVMEKRHHSYIQSRFPEIAGQCEIIVLGIPDEYGYLDEELIAELEARLAPYLP